ncbi:hypothetical protein [Vreelandella azerica]|uniref:hypothetical protein n=1 Tax=Vreelandella azerica TaxID=2732867 RepID=UPI001F37A03B|nr:hypothetical protein [Halomonas azerica]
MSVESLMDTLEKANLRGLGARVSRPLKNGFSSAPRPGRAIAPSTPMKASRALSRIVITWSARPISFSKAP